MLIIHLKLIHSTLIRIRTFMVDQKYIKFMMINGFSLKRPKKLQQIIKDFTSHPVTPQKLYWQRKYDIEKAEYAARYKDSEIEFSSKEFESAGIDTTDCETERVRAMKEIKEYKEAELQKCKNNH